MADYLHGAYGQIQAVGTKLAAQSHGAFIYVGTAPVHTVEGGANNVNVPILVKNIAEARRIFGYSDDWANYTLCEAMHAHLENKEVGPLVLINVLDPTTHKSGTQGSVDKTPVNGIITIPSATEIYLDSVTVKTKASPAVTKVKGTDYTISYNQDKGVITIKEIGTGLGSSELAITYDVITPASVTDATVIGASDGAGSNTGLFAVKNVYQATGLVPMYLAAPGFSSHKTVHEAMYQNAVKVNGHWDLYMFVDLPLMNNGTQLTFDTIATYKSQNGFTKENETVFFPMAEGVDGAYYHISVLAAANFQELLLQQDDIPYKTASNTECAIISNLYMGASYTGRVFDDELINSKLNKNGIASAAFVGGRWVIWGCHSADYNPTDGDQINVSETNRMMLYYISNNFQHRRPFDVDKPMTANDLRSIVSQEQARLDALINIGALIYGTVSLNADSQAESDIMNGDFSFTFNVTVTPLARSLTAVVNWTKEGFVTYYENLLAD